MVYGESAPFLRGGRYLYNHTATRDLDKPRRLCNISMQETHAFIQILFFLMVTLTHQSIVCHCHIF